MTGLEARLAPIRERARRGLAQRADELVAEVERLLAGDEGARERILRSAHKIRGLGGTIGRPDLTERAGRLEDAIRRAALPVAIAEGANRLAKAVRASTPDDPNRRSSPPPATRKQKLGWKTWVVDDESATLQLLRLTLRSGACDVVAFDDPQRMLDTTSDRPAPELVVVDAMMPSMNGLQVYRALRERYGASLPIVILSAAEPADLEWQLPDDDRLEWMRKPFRSGVLLQSLRAFVEKR